jgi:hypothetical protein
MIKCGGCKARQDMLNQAAKQVKQGQFKPAMQSVGKVATSAARDAARLMRSPLSMKRGR